MKILVVALDNLGDAVMATALARPLRQAIPDAEIGYWVKSYAADLLRDHPLIQHVHASDPFWDTSPGHPKGAFTHFWKVVREIKKEKYDTVLILNTEWRRAGLCWRMGIPTRVGYNRRKSRIFLTQAVAGPNVQNHFVEDHRVLMQSWLGSAVSSDLIEPTLGISMEEESKFLKLLQDKNWTRVKLISFHPFAGDPLKCWPIHGWLELMKNLISLDPDIKFLVHCGPGEEKALKEDLKTIPEECSLLLSNQPLGFIKAALKNSRLFVGGDSGPSHIAVAFGVPSIVLFGPTRSVRCAPRGPGPVHVLQTNPITELTVEKVQETVLRLLGQSV